jgi:glutathione-regulated potassium-efflux system ancillary protein KefG
MRAFWKFSRKAPDPTPRVSFTKRIVPAATHGRRAIIVLAHPALQRSRVNAALLAAVADMADTVTFHDLYEAYADFLVDVEAEQRQLEDHDLIILQFPLYWYSTPALLKEWLDMVWLHGFAYGRTGTKLQGKTLLCAVTTGAEPESYMPSGQNRFAIEEFLRPWEATAHLCGLKWAKPFIVHNSFQIEEPEVVAAARAYRARVTAQIAALPPPNRISTQATAA